FSSTSTTLDRSQQRCVLLLSLYAARRWIPYTCFFFSSRRRHTRSVSAFLLNRSSDLKPLRDFIVEASSNLEHSSLIPFFLGQLYSSRISLRGRSAASLRQNCVTVFSFSKNHFSSPSGRWSIVLLISSWGSTL